jgi:hypothetical protein
VLRLIEQCEHGDSGSASGVERFNPRSIDVALDRIKIFLEVVGEIFYKCGCVAQGEARSERLSNALRNAADGETTSRP